MTRFKYRFLTLTPSAHLRSALKRKEIVLRTGNRVKLIAFNNETSTPEDCEPEENYWLLIGELATVIEPETIYGRALIEFDVLVTSKGLYCHNEIPNTLLILESDLLLV